MYKIKRHIQRNFSGVVSLFLDKKIPLSNSNNPIKTPQCVNMMNMLTKDSWTIL